MISGPIDATKVELGCGSHKREGFFGIDIAPGPQVDLVLDIEHERLPFPDSSVEHIYSSHTFEHLYAAGSPIHTLREIMRVAAHGALVEIWTPYGKSDDGFLFGHSVFYTETHWKHICFEYDDFYLGENNIGRFTWEKTQYVLHPTVLKDLKRMKVSVEFAITHFFNVVLEFGVFLRVDKNLTKAIRPQYPERQLCLARGNVIRTLSYHTPLGKLRRKIRRIFSGRPGLANYLP